LSLRLLRTAQSVIKMPNESVNRRRGGFPSDGRRKRERRAY
jgi:hypothetical protein